MHYVVHGVETITLISGNNGQEDVFEDPTVSDEDKTERAQTDQESESGVASIGSNELGANEGAREQLLAARRISAKN
jgi:hypothetical protein